MLQSRKHSALPTERFCIYNNIQKMGAGRGNAMYKHRKDRKQIYTRVPGRTYTLNTLSTKNLHIEK